jgi:hypothetical protein
LDVIEQIEAGGRVYKVADDETITYRALVVGTVRDLITGLPLGRDFTLGTDQSGVSVKVLSGGIFCVSGYSERVFPHLATTGYNVTLTINAAGFREAARIINIPQNAVLPVIAPAIDLERLPVRIQGRVVEDTSDRNPIPDARVITVGGPAPLNRVVALRTPLHFGHALGVTINECDLNAAGLPKQLAAIAPQGGFTLRLNNRTGLAVNSILRIGPDTHAEYAVIESLAPEPADLNRPGEVRLRSALNHRFAESTEVQRVTLAIPGGGAVTHFSRDGGAGDGIIILEDNLDVSTIQIDDPVASRVEYHAVGAVSDNEGFYRLDGINQVGEVELTASAAGFSPLAAPLRTMIDYDRQVNVINFRLSQP